MRATLMVLLVLAAPPAPAQQDMVSGTWPFSASWPATFR